MSDYVKFKNGFSSHASDVKSEITYNATKYKIPPRVKKSDRHQWLGQRMQIELIQDDTMEFDVVASVSIITDDRSLVESLNEKFQHKYPEAKIFIL
jgi:hypothetical protein